MVAATALSLAFVVLYALGVGYGQGGRSERVPRLATVGLAVIALALAPLVGTGSAIYLVLTTVLTVFAWPVRASLPAVVATVAWAAVLPVLTGDDGPVWWVFPVLVAGIALAMYGMRRMVVQQGEIERAHEQLAELAVADERHRFARDLHDVLGHSLTAIAVKAELAGKLVERDAGRARAEVADIGRLAREGLEDVRRTVADARRASLEGELAAARAALAAAGIRAELPYTVDAVPGDRRELFAWAVREGVTNVVRHSGARRCEVRLSADAVEVLDDGHGGPSVAGHGLRGLADRASAAGATLETGSAPAGGHRMGVTFAPRDTAPAEPPEAPAARAGEERVP